MYKLGHLARVAWAGFEDMAPAVQRAFNERADDDRLNLVFGPAPRVALMATLYLFIIGATWTAASRGRPVR